MVEAGAAHAAVMAAVHGAAFPRDPWDAAAFAALLGQPGVFGLLDPRGGVVVARVAADEAEILTIGAARVRAGIGRALMHAALARARAAGAASMFLEVAEANTPAVGLYQAMGFELVGRRRGYYADGTDAVVMRRALAPGAAA